MARNLYLDASIASSWISHPSRCAAHLPCARPPDSLISNTYCTFSLRRPPRHRVGHHGPRPLATAFPTRAGHEYLASMGDSGDDHVAAGSGPSLATSATGTPAAGPALRFRPSDVPDINTFKHYFVRREEDWPLFFTKLEQHIYNDLALALVHFTDVLEHFNDITPADSLCAGKLWTAILHDFPIN